MRLTFAACTFAFALFSAGSALAQDAGVADAAASGADAGVADAAANVARGAGAAELSASDWDPDQRGYVDARQQHNFEDEAVAGDLVRPDGELLVGRAATTSEEIYAVQSLDGSPANSWYGELSMGLGLTHVYSDDPDANVLVGIEGGRRFGLFTAGLRLELARSPDEPLYAIGTTTGLAIDWGAMTFELAALLSLASVEEVPDERQAAFAFGTALSASFNPSRAWALGVRVEDRAFVLFDGTWSELFGLSAFVRTRW